MTDEISQEERKLLTDLQQRVEKLMAAYDAVNRDIAEYNEWMLPKARELSNNRASKQEWDELLASEDNTIAQKLCPNGDGRRNGYKVALELSDSHKVIDGIISNVSKLLEGDDESPHRRNRLAQLFYFAAVENTKTMQHLEKDAKTYMDMMRETDPAVFENPELAPLKPRFDELVKNYFPALEGEIELTKQAASEWHKCYSKEHPHTKAGEVRESVISSGVGL